MKAKFRSIVAAIAFAALAAQPIAANAAAALVQSSSSSSAAGTIMPMVWGVEFILCTGMTMGLQDTHAAALGVAVSNAARLRAFLVCAFPAIGLHRLMTHQPPPQ